MSEQGEMLAKLSKSQKKKKSAQKKKLAKKNAREEEESAAAQNEERKRDEIDARTVEQFHDNAMWTHDFQMLNIRGKLLVHPSKSFFDAFTGLRQTMGRDTYPNRINLARRFYMYQFGGNNDSFPTWSGAMGIASYIHRFKSRPEHDKGDADEGSREDGVGEGIVRRSRFYESEQERKGAFTDQSFGALGLMIWYPIFVTCMGVGDKLACIALRDSCVLLRTCYGLFRNDTTRLEQFVFDARNPSSAKQLDWVARRVEVPPSPPQTPLRGVEPEAAPSCPNEPDSLLAKDPFRSPIVVTKRWADYDDDDESLGSPMSLPVTPESSAPWSDVPSLDLDGSSNGSNAATSRVKETSRRPPSIVVATPTLTATARWFSTNKTVLPVPRLSVFTFEDFPRTHRTSSDRPMKLQSSSLKYAPGPPSTGNVRVRARLEHWVREDTEKNLKAKLSLGLSSAAKKVVDAQAESAVFNRVAALASVNNCETAYFGEPDILGAGMGVSVEDVRDMVTGRFRAEKEKGDEDDSRVWSEYWSKDAKTVRLMLVPSAEGWICRHLDDFQT